MYITVMIVLQVGCGMEGEETLISVKKKEHKIHTFCSDMREVEEGLIFTFIYIYYIFNYILT